MKFLPAHSRGLGKVQYEVLLKNRMKAFLVWKVCPGEHIYQYYISLVVSKEDS